MMLSKTVWLRLFLPALFSLCCSVAGPSGESSWLCPHPAWPQGKAIQGMDIYRDYLLQAHNQGMLSVYRFDGKSLTLLGEFDLQSAHKNNHANVLSFGRDFYDRKDPMPLVYVSQAAKKPVEEYKDVCYVERIAPDLQSSTLVQTICYDDRNGDFGYALQWVVDRKAGMLYGYGNTTRDRDVEGNRHRIIKFRLPPLDKSRVVLRPEDALENYLIEDGGFRFATIGQGLFIWKGRLYMPTGLGTEADPSRLYVWDLKRRKMLKEVDLGAVMTGEPEDMGRYKDRFIISGMDGIFQYQDK